MKDLLTGRVMTWPYGTQKKVDVLQAEPDKFIICAEGNVGYVLLWTDSDQAKAGDRGTITFTEGGPLGGYWKFKKEVLAETKPAGH